MDTALQNALKRRAEHVKEIEKIDRFIEQYQEFSGVKIAVTAAFTPPLTAMLHSTPVRAFDSGKAVAGHGDDGTEAESAIQKKRANNPSPEVLIPAAIEIMRETGRPMSRREVHTALAARGLEVRGAEPTKTLGTMLWRARDHIDSIEGRGYWPKGDPVPPVSMEEPHAALLAGRRRKGKSTS